LDEPGTRGTRKRRLLWLFAPALVLVASQVVQGTNAPASGDAEFFSVTNLTLRPHQLMVQGTGLELAPTRVRPIGLSTTDEKIYEAVRMTREDKLDDAMALLDEVLGTDPKNRVARTTRSIVLTTQFRYAEAIAVLESLMMDYPNDIGILNNLAWVFATASDRSLRDGVRAVELAKSALISSPRNFHVWSTLSEGYYVTGSFKRAVHSATEALKLGTQAGASAKDILIYREQMRKAQRALVAFQIVE
jgi:predicted Zn-dependent protease